MIPVKSPQIHGRKLLEEEWHWPSRKNAGSGRPKMKNQKTTTRSRIKVEKGSGNVFADLGLNDSDQLMARGQIGFYVFKILEDRKMKQREMA